MNFFGNLVALSLGAAVQRNGTLPVAVGAENRHTAGRHKGKRDMHRNAIRLWMVLTAILPLPFLLLAAQETTSPPIDGQVGQLRVIYVQAQEQSKSPAVQPFSLRNGVTIRLSGDWGPDLYDRTPTPSALHRHALREIGFSEFLNLQNLKEHSLLKLASSNNPFQGPDQRDLDAQMHELPSSGRGLLNYLSYFFFPPPAHCVEQAFADDERAISKSKPDEDADVSIAANCQYFPTLPDFYSAQLSHGLVFRRLSSLASVDSTWGEFYLPEVAQVETNGLTFFVYEAQGLEQLTLETARKFNLPEELQGAQVDFFWAIGAPSPFPFLVDPTHRNIPLIHVVYAGVDLGPNQRPVFMKLLQKVTVPGMIQGTGIR
jgi:hypothetical protein